MSKKIVIWSAVQNDIITLYAPDDQLVVGRHQARYRSDDFLEKTHFTILFKDGIWGYEVLESNNGTFHNGKKQTPGTFVELKPFDNIFAGDQVLVVIDKAFFDLESRTDFIKKITTEGDEKEIIDKILGGRSIQLYKSDFKVLKEAVLGDEVEANVGVLTAKMQKELKAYDQKIAEIESKKQAWIKKRNQIEQAWIQKINEEKSKVN